MTEGYYRINLERYNMTKKEKEVWYTGGLQPQQAYPLVRIADALEEILRLVKKDQEDSAARQRQWDNEKN